MKPGILVLSVLASSGLIAQDDSYQSNSYVAMGDCCSSCGCSTCECKPCCVPQPKKCIDCECYTPAYYDLQCDWGAFVTVDFLYWYARETNLSYAAVITQNPVTTVSFKGTTETFILEPSSYQHMKTAWDPGFRVGLGWNSGCDGWDTSLTWTYYANKKKSSSSIADYAGIIEDTAINQSGLTNPWTFGNFLSYEVGNLSGPLLFQKVSAKWNLYFNQIDLELGRKYWLSRCFTLRPYTGLRGAWVKTNFNTRSSSNFEDSNLSPNSILYKDQFTSRSWGVGLLGGLQPNWHFCSNFILYSNFDIALIWGEFKQKKKENYLQTLDDPTSGINPDATITFNNNSNSNFYMMQPILDLAIGLRWEETWCCDRYRTALDLGWEHHVWFDYNHRNKFDRQTFSQGVLGSIPAQATALSYDEATGNLGMGGLVVRLRFDF